MDIRGTCHCGNLRFVLTWPRTEDMVSGRRCTCAYCTRTGTIWVGESNARLLVNLIDAQSATRYRFATETAEFIACSACAVVALVTSRINGQLFGLVNAKTFEAGPKIDATSVSFDGEGSADRLERRRRRWISQITLPREFCE